MLSTNDYILITLNTEGSLLSRNV